MPRIVDTVFGELPTGPKLGAWGSLCVALALGVIGCKSHVAPSGWALSVEAVTAIPTASSVSNGMAVPQRCSTSNDRCSTVQGGERLLPGERIRLAGPHAVRLQGHPGTLWLNHEADLVLVSSPRPTVELKAGQLAIDGRGTEPYSVRFLGQEATLDRVMPTRISLRILDSERAEVTVMRGRLQVRRSDGATIELRSGDSVALGGKGTPVRAPATLFVEPKACNDTVTTSAVPRGLGRMTARNPASGQSVDGVRLVSHIVKTQIVDGIARTEIEASFENTTAQVLEGRFVFQLPADATVSRLALWVGKKLMEGEVVERKHASSIFDSIVNDSFQPTDPALLQWEKGAEVSLRVFPILAHGTRQILLTYEQLLDVEDEVTTYVYPLATEGRPSSATGHFVFDLTIAESQATLQDVQTPGYVLSPKVTDHGATIHHEQDGVELERDLVVTYRRALGANPDISYQSSDGASYLFARVTPEPPEVLASTLIGLDRVFVLDRSYSQSKAALDRATGIVAEILTAMDPDERFAVLACDSACEAFPAAGLQGISDGAVEAAKRWLQSLEIGGASDLAGALVAGAARAREGKQRQLVYFGDGGATAGELGVESVAGRVSRALASQGIDLRLFGGGASIDREMLSGLSRRLGASYGYVKNGTPAVLEGMRLAMTLRQAVMSSAQLTASPDITEVYPAQLPAVILGEPIAVVAKMRPHAVGQLTFSGQLNGKSYVSTTAVAGNGGQAPSNPFLERIWADARIGELEASSAGKDRREAIELARRHRILSENTSWIVLESEAMYEQYGLRNRRGRPRLGESSPTDRPSSLPAEELVFRDSREQPVGSAPRLSGSAGAIRPGGEGGNLASLGRTEIPIKTADVNAPRGSATLGGITTSGGGIADVDRVVGNLRAGFRACYNRELKVHPEASGTLQVTIIVGAQGEVTQVAAVEEGHLGTAVECVRARARVAQFEPPQGDAPATVHLPVVFARGPASQPPLTVTPPPPASPLPERHRVSESPPEPPVIHEPGNERWRTANSDERLLVERALRGSPRSRSVNEQWIRWLLVKGQFGDALAAASEFIARDPDFAPAYELLAYAAAVTGDGDRAILALAQGVEVAADDSRAQLRQARAYALKGDQGRACAHYRAYAELAASDESAKIEVLRCRALDPDDRKVVLGELHAEESPSEFVKALTAQLEAGTIPVAETLRDDRSAFQVTVECYAPIAECPFPVIITPLGNVLSPWTPGVLGATKTKLALSNVHSGPYRTLLIGGRAGTKGRVEITALGQRRRFPFAHGGDEQTVATSTIQPSLGNL